MDRGEALHDTRERTSERPQIQDRPVGETISVVNAPPAFIRSLRYCHQKAKRFSIASRMSTNLTIG